MNFRFQHDGAPVMHDKGRQGDPDVMHRSASDIALDRLLRALPDSFPDPCGDPDVVARRVADIMRRIEERNRKRSSRAIRRLARDLEESSGKFDFHGTRILP